MFSLLYAVLNGSVGRRKVSFRCVVRAGDGSFNNVSRKFCMSFFLKAELSRGQFSLPGGFGVRLFLSHAPTFGKLWFAESQIFRMLTHFFMDCWSIGFMATDLQRTGFIHKLPKRMVLATFTQTNSA